MRTTILMICLLTSACAGLTPRERTVLKVAGAVLVVGAIAAHQADHGANGQKTIDPPLCPGVQCQ